MRTVLRPIELLPMPMLLSKATARTSCKVFNEFQDFEHARNSSDCRSWNVYYSIMSVFLMTWSQCQSAMYVLRHVSFTYKTSDKVSSCCHCTALGKTPICALAGSELVTPAIRQITYF